MDNTILVGLLSLAGTLIGSATGILTANRLTNYRIEQLEKRVAAHNNLIDRTYKLEQRTEVLDERIDVANHRIADLEDKP